MVAGRAAKSAAAAAQKDAPAESAQASEADPSEREVPANPRAELLAAALLVLAGCGGFGFTALYVVFPHNTQLMGAAIGCGLLFLALAFVVIGRLVVPQDTDVEERDALLDEAQVEEIVDDLVAGGEGISRRALLAGAGGVAGAGLVVGLVTPVASSGPNLTGIHHTQWHRGRLLVADTGTPYLAEDIDIGSFYTALPADGDPEQLDASLLVIRLPAEYIHLPATRRHWAPQGIMAFSKICPHAACAISLYRYPTYAPVDGSSGSPAFTCPCHYSTFLPGDGGKLIFGPAGRDLPQLPLMIDSRGQLRAAGGFDEDVGPSWWNVHRVSE